MTLLLLTMPRLFGTCLYLNLIYPLASSAGPHTFYLMLITSLFKTLHYPLRCVRLPAFGDFLRDSYCASLVMTTNASIIPRMQKSVKDNSSPVTLKLPEYNSIIKEYISTCSKHYFS